MSVEERSSLRMTDKEKLDETVRLLEQVLNEWARQSRLAIRLYPEARTALDFIAYLAQEKISD